MRLQSRLERLETKAAPAANSAVQFWEGLSLLLSFAEPPARWWQLPETREIAADAADLQFLLNSKG